MEIKFIPKLEHQLEPIPAIKQLPDWYKKMSAYTHGKKDIFYSNGENNETIKRCNPVSDALSSGYFILLENDVYVTKASDSENKKPEMHWLRGGDDFISVHPKIQTSSELVPEGFNRQAFKFKNFWGVKTPNGYSTLFMHPLNRPELPFYTLQGVVDTDTFNESVDFPFYIKEDFEGILKAGTPVAQVIPFKRDKWTSFIASPNPYEREKMLEQRSRSRMRWYKNNFWIRKEYK